MKHLRGYLTAAIFAGITYALSQYGKQFAALVDMVYPYVIRTLEQTLAQWSSQVDFLIWQLLAAALLVVVIAALVVVIVTKKSVIQWFGWVLAAGSFVFMLHTLVYGMNYHAGDLSADLRMDVTGCTLEEIVDATEYYQSQANVMAAQAGRDAQGYLSFEDFDTLASRAGMGFQYLTYQRFYPVFAGSTLPVKKLGWADMYTSMGITGVTFGLTGESAVNPQIPQVLLPFTMCHEMSHRMCIASERDANFSAFLACSAHPDNEFEYSGYFMAFRYCYNSLASVRTTAAAQYTADLRNGISPQLQKDLDAYNAFFRAKQDQTATRIADTANDTYLRASGEASGIASYSQVCDLLVSWHIQEVVLPAISVTESPFDPYDKNQVDVSDIR